MKSFFGHPPGLATLFFTEMWERFSYYGGRAMLILYMTAAVVGENPGLGLSVIEAGALYGLYTAVVYMTNLPGGWIADKFIGARNAVFYGGIIIALGNLMLAAPFGPPSFYAGLGLIAIGTGLLKPNVSTMVGSLYSQGDIRRDSAFSIFYMGINLGAFLAPLIAGYFGQNVNWRTGFLVVAIGMVLGLIQYKLGAKHLGEAGKHVRTSTDEEHAKQQKALRNGALGFLAVAAILVALHFTGIYLMTVVNLSNMVGILLLVIPVIYFGFLFTRGGFDSAEKKRIVAIIIFYLAAALFWSAFEQAGSTLTLFADRHTDNSIFGAAFPSTWWQSINALFIIVLSGVFAWLWIKLAKMQREPSTPMKFVIGLLLVGVGFLILVPAAILIEKTGARVGIHWLLMLYFIHTVGELFLSPVGLSAMTKLAPARIVGQMMGIWFLGAATGNFIGGRVGGLFESFPLKNIFLAVFIFSLAASLVMFFLVPWMKRLMGEVK
jgi:proton-dependent oligopeptide transporter, POT family